MRETIVNEITYSNPAKLMNYLKAQKARGNSSFRTQAEYVSHVDAYARNTAVEPKEDQNDRRLKYAKLLAHKRLNDPAYSGVHRPPKPADTTQSSIKSGQQQSQKLQYKPNLPPKNQSFYTLR